MTGGRFRILTVDIAERWSRRVTQQKKIVQGSENPIVLRANSAGGGAAVRKNDLVVEHLKTGDMRVGIMSCACCARIYARPLALACFGPRGELSIDFLGCSLCVLGFP